MLVHAALLYDSDEAFADATAGFVREGLERSEPVLAVTTKRNRRLLRDRLGGGAERLQLEDSRRWLRTPEAALASFQEFVAARLAEGAAWTRIIGEPLWAGRSAAEVRLWTRFESLVNVAFAASPLSLLCPYDTRALEPQVIEQACSTHPRVIASGELADSTSYRDPVGFAIESPAEPVADAAGRASGVARRSPRLVRLRLSPRLAWPASCVPRESQL